MPSLPETNLNSNKFDNIIIFTMESNIYNYKWAQLYWKEKILLSPKKCTHGTRVLDTNRSSLRSSILSFWLTLACSTKCKNYIFGQ